MPVRAAVGDQQASLFGLRCWEPGAAKVTLGTGAFVLAHAGEAPPRRPARRPRLHAPGAASGTTSYALEGFIPTAGAAVDWFARIGALPPARSSTRCCARPATTRVVCVPALQGLGTPSWDASARGALLGLSLGTTRADLARAVVDGVLHQVADAVEAIGVEELWVDGGLSRSDWIVQRLADLAGVARPPHRPRRLDRARRRHARRASPRASGRAPRRCRRSRSTSCAEPQLAAAEREHERDRWAEAREVTTGR